MRRMIAVLLAAGLAIAVMLLWWFRPVEDTPPATEAAPATTSTTTTTEATTTTTVATTTTTPDAGSHVVETVEEAEEILRELWFGWFEGIYHQDEDRIREVVILESTVDHARESFGVMEFSSEPLPELIGLQSVEILHSDEQCLAVWSELDVSAFRPGAVGTSGVYVSRFADGVWALLSVWPNRADLWDGDCESLLP